MLRATIGIIGAGNIIGQYLTTFDGMPDVRVAAIAAATVELAAAVATPRGIRACSASDLLAEPGIDLVLNLTPPSIHTQISRAAVSAGKHVYSEKPLALSGEEGTELLGLAEKAGVQLGCAPDTFLGTGLQTTADALRSGMIGEPVAALAMWGSEGPEPWHPNPQIFYSTGGGPVLDMGPYYITALVQHLGPVVSVLARNSTSRRRRVVGSGPLAGTPLDVKVPTYATAILAHEGGVLSTVVLSFETCGDIGMLEIMGTAGRLQLPDPNQFSEKGSVRTSTEPGEWRELPDSAGYVDAGRGVGAAELLASVSAGRLPRASGQLALHVTEILCAINAADPANPEIQIRTRPPISELVELGAQPLR